VVAQRFAHAGSEAVVLNQDGHQLTDFRFAGAFRKIAQGVGAPLARPHLQVNQRQIFAELRVALLQLPPHVLDRLVQAKPASTETTIRSSASGSERRIMSCRLATFFSRTNRGIIHPAATRTPSGPSSSRGWAHFR